MTWLKVSDAAAMHPLILAAASLPDADERTVNELFGFLIRMALHAAQHNTDYRVNIGTAQVCGTQRTRELLEMCETLGLCRGATDPDVPGAFTLVQDDDLFHMLSAQEVAWSRQQRNDTRNRALTVPVRRRDGDQCRWCGFTVAWRGRTTQLSGTLDHLRPGEPGTVETLVVACKKCNSGHQDFPNWEDEHPLLPVPKDPLYGETTAKFLTDNGFTTRPNIGSHNSISKSTAASDTKSIPGSASRLASSEGNEAKLVDLSAQTPLSDSSVHSEAVAKPDGVRPERQPERGATVGQSVVDPQEGRSPGHASQRDTGETDTVQGCGLTEGDPAVDFKENHASGASVVPVAENMGGISTESQLKVDLIRYLRTDKTNYARVGSGNYSGRVFFGSGLSGAGSCEVGSGRGAADSGGVACSGSAGSPGVVSRRRGRRKR